MTVRLYMFLGPNNLSDVSVSNRLAGEIRQPPASKETGAAQVICVLPD
jgi:hypothetical protein